MKQTIITICFFFSLCTAFSQPKTIREKQGQRSEIGDIGNNNTITVIQSHGSVTYNLNRSASTDSFLKYLLTLPGISKQIAQIFRLEKETNKIVEENNALLKQLVNNSKNNGVFDTSEFHVQIDKYREENQRLREENERLMQLATNADYAEVLKEANRKLEEYDNVGYQLLLDEYKAREKAKIVQQRKDIASASYLQAGNNYTVYKYREALVQINEAIENESGNSDYLYLKAQILYELSRYDECLPIYFSVLELLHDDTTTLSCYNVIGLTYDGKGDYDKALEYLSKALAIGETIFGKENINTATIYSNIGTAYLGKKDYDKALEYLNRALVIEETLLGKEHPNTAATYSNMGTVYGEMRDHSRALEYYGKTLAIQEKVLSSEHPSTAVTYSNVASVYDDQGDFDMALEYFGKALVIDEKFLGKEHFNTAIVYNKIGMVYKEKKDHDQAVEYLKRALRIEEKVLGKEHVNTAKTYSNIAKIYDNKRDYDKALEYYSKVLIAREKNLGEEHPNTIAIYNSMAEICKKKVIMIKRWSIIIEFW